MLVKNFAPKAAITLVMIVFLICSCKNRGIGKRDELDGKYRVKILVSSGENINIITNDTLNFLNYPFNVGVKDKSKPDKTQIAVIGKRLKSGQVISVKPLAKLTYVGESDRVIEMIVVRPIEDKFVTVKIDNYFELLSVHNGIQKMIDTWVLYSQGLGKVTDLKWENEDKAIEFFSS